MQPRALSPSHRVIEDTRPPERERRRRFGHALSVRLRMFLCVCVSVCVWYARLYAFVWLSRV